MDTGFLPCDYDQLESRADVHEHRFVYYGKTVLVVVRGCTALAVQCKSGESAATAVRVSSCTLVYKPPVDAMLPSSQSESLGCATPAWEE